MSIVILHFKIKAEITNNLRCYYYYCNFYVQLTNLCAHRVRSLCAICCFIERGTVSCAPRKTKAAEFYYENTKPDVAPVVR